MIKRVHSILVLIFFSYCAYSQSGWVLRKEKDGIFIYDLKTDTSKFNSIKVETELAGRVEDLLFILMDVKNHYRWAYGTKSATVLKRISDKEVIFYKEINSPALMVSDRDIIIRMKVIPNATSKSISVESTALPNFIPAKKDLVRVPMSNEKWIITPLSNQRVKISYFLQIDPGGALPPLLVNLFVARGPYESFTNLKELLKSRTNKWQQQK
jgi:START domain